MRKIENWLFLPVLGLFCRSFFVRSTLDFHLHDTYYVVDGISLYRWQAYALLIIFGMYKTIRYRHETVNLVFAFPHIFITLLLIGLALFPPSVSGRRYLDYSNWATYRSMQWDVIAVIAYLLVQVIFLGYFIVQLVRKPVSSVQ